MIAISVAVYQFSGHDSVAVGILFLVRMGPYVLFGSYLGSVASRLGYRRAMVTADVGRAVAVALLALVLSPASWLALYPLAFIIAALGALFRPASAGIIPSLVRSDGELLAANSTLMQADNIALLLGSLIGGVVAGQGHVSLLLAVQAATFAVSAGSLLLIHPHVSDQSIDEMAAFGGAVVESGRGGVWLSGFRLVTARPILLFVISIVLLPELVSGAVIVWFAPYSNQVLHLGNAGIGYLFAALGAGSIIGGFVAAAIGGNRPLDAVLSASVALGGVALAIFGLAPTAVIAIGAVAVLGAAETVELAAMDTLVQQGIPERLIGPAMGTIMSVCMSFMLFGNVVSGVLARVPGLRPSIVGMGILVTVVVPVVWQNYRRRQGELPAEDQLMGIPSFAALPVDVRGWAVGRMERRLFPAGAVLMRQGDAGDSLFAIGSGRISVEVARHDAPLVTTELGPGHIVGEIALLHDVPRTATVTALSPLVAYSLSRQDVDELRSRAGEFRESLLDMATARLGDQGTLGLGLAGLS